MITAYQRTRAVVEHWQKTACPSARVSAADTAIVIDFEHFSVGIETVSKLDYSIVFAQPKLEQLSPEKIAVIGAQMIQLSNLISAVRALRGS